MKGLGPATDYLGSSRDRPIPAKPQQTRTRMRISLCAQVLLGGLAACAIAAGAESCDRRTRSEASRTANKADEQTINARVQLYIEGYAPALAAVDGRLRRVLGVIPGVEVRTRRAIPERPGLSGLKSPASFMEKVQRMLEESRQAWAHHDLVSSAPVGVYPREASLDQALAMTMKALPHEQWAVRDIAGLRVVVPAFDRIADATRTLSNEFRDELVSVKDFYGKEYRNDGYVGRHFVVLVLGKPVEIQLRTRAEDRWASWSHRHVYKKSLSELVEVSEYSRRTGERVLQQETGTCRAPCLPPPCPEVLRIADGCFGW